MAILDELPNDLGLSPFEVACGFVFGSDPNVEPLPEDVGSARQELETVLRSALEEPPCSVAFSGGRDSSAILALATDIANREGLAPPVPITRRHLDAPNADEDEWQELVIRHLDLKNWERLVVADELDMIGPVAIEAVRRHGPLHPSFGHLSVPLYRAAGGGSLLSGEGGDEFFDDRRMVYARRLLKRVKRRPTRSNLASLAYTLAPVAARRPWQLRQFERGGEFFGWLQPDPRRQAIEMLAHRVADEPLWWSPFMKWAYRQRWATVPGRMADLLADDEGVRNIDPLYMPRVVAALAKERPLRGYRDRSAAYKNLFGSLLPDSVWDRASKASFGEAVITPMARAFADGWDGSGFDEDIIDVAALHAEWQRPNPQIGALGLLQLAWLGSEGVVKPPDEM